MFLNESQRSITEPRRLGNKLEFKTQKNKTQSSLATVYYLKCLVFNHKLLDMQRNGKV